MTTDPNDRTPFDIISELILELKDEREIDWLRGELSERRAYVAEERRQRVIRIMEERGYVDKPAPPGEIRDVLLENFD